MYIVEAVCMGAVLVLISLVPLQDGPPYRNLSSNSPGAGWSTATANATRLPWLLPLLPVLLISVVATGILALQQSALPLDLVRGGLVRPALSESHSSALIALQLTLLVSLQWPVGRWLAERSVAFGLGLSLAGFSLGCSLIALSSLFENGTILVLQPCCRWPSPRPLSCPRPQKPSLKRHHQNTVVWRWRCFPSASPSAPSWLPSLEEPCSTFKTMACCSGC